MKKLILLLIICVIASIIVSCDFNAAREALAKTFETIGGDKETTEPLKTGDENPFVGSITDLIREDNKTITGIFTEKTQWIEMYKTQLFGNKEIIETKFSGGAELSQLSDYFGISVTNFDITFSDGSTDKLSVIDTDQDDTRTLVDIIYYDSLPELYDTDYIYELLRSDSRFAAKMNKDYMNKYPENTIEIDIAKIVPQYHRDYSLSSASMMSDNVVEIVLRSSSYNEIIIEYDYVEHMILSENEQTYEPTSYERITTLSTSDGKHTAYIDETTLNLYVRDNDTGDVWLIYEEKDHTSNEEFNEVAIIKYIYNNKLVYSIGGYEMMVGFGIYDFKSNENTVYLDTVAIVGLQNGVLFLDGSYGYNENIAFTIDLHSDDYKVTDISDHIYTYIPENTSYAIRLEGSGDGIKVKLYNTLSNIIMSEHLFTFKHSSIQNIDYYNNKLIITCPQHAMGHDYIYITDVS